MPVSLEKNDSRINETLNTFSGLILAAILFMICFFPRQFSGIKFALILVFILLRMGDCLNKSIDVKKYRMFIFYALYCLVGILSSIANGWFNIMLLKVPVAWFLLFACFLGAFNSSDVDKIVIGCFCAFVAIIIYNLMLVGVAYGLIPMNPLVRLDYTAAVGIHDGYIHITSTNTSMLILLYPLFVTAAMLLDRKSLKNLHLNRMVLRVTVFVASVCILLTGRRILWLSMAFSWVFVILIAIPKKRMKKILPVFLAAVCLIILYLGVKGNLSGLIDRFTSAFSKDDIRFEQIETLWDYFLKKPILGYGFGAQFYLPSRGWVDIVETTFMLVLFQTGLLGFVCYVAFFVILIYKMAKLECQSNLDRFLKYFSISALFFSVLATATNPYIGSSFDFYILIFVPLFSLKKLKSKKSKSICEQRGFEVK